MKTITFKEEYKNVDDKRKTNLTKQTAAEGMVLLKNKNHVFPFKRVTTIGIAEQNAILNLNHNKLGIISGGGRLECRGCCVFSKNYGHWFDFYR